MIPLLRNARMSKLTAPGRTITPSPALPTWVKGRSTNASLLKRRPAERWPFFKLAGQPLASAFLPGRLGRY